MVLNDQIWVGNMQPARFLRSDALTALVLVALYAVNLYVTTQLRSHAGGADSLWTANAFGIAALLLLPRMFGYPVVLLCVAFQCAFSMSIGRPFVPALSYALVNLLEAVVVSTLIRRAGVERLTTPGRVAGLLFLAILPGVLLSTLAASTASMILDHRDFVATFVRRFPAKFLGICLVLPAIMLLSRRNAMPGGPAKPSQMAIFTLLIAACCGLMTTRIGQVPLFLLFPLITVLGFRMGPRAVTLAMIAVAMVIFPVSIFWGGGQFFRGGWTPAAKVFMTQVYIATVFFTGVITALGARHQQRLRNLFARKSESAMRARDRARAASLAKTEFLATMSHEIRTPLNSIIGFAQVLDRRDDLPAKARHQIGLIERSGGALLTVVNDILDFSKVEAGRIDLDPKPVDLQAACQDALSIVGENAVRKGLALSMTAEGAGEHAHICDDHRLRQVLLNFLNNAVKFTDAGTVSLHLAVKPAGERDRVRISVTDTGVGISEDAADRLFQRFTQVDSSISRTHGGTGLGLAICKGLVELMGGKVGVSSVPGEGSTFWLELTLDRAEAISDITSEEDEGEGLSAHILLVDDHPMNRELGTTVLGLLGCTNDVACDGREAIEAARTRRYDAILMDVHMPGVDGLAATRAIRALTGPASQTPIIAMSADVLPEQLAKMREAGMIDSVGKPIDIQTLHDCLTRWVGRTADGEMISEAA